MVRISSIAGLMILLGTAGYSAGAEDQVLEAGNATIEAMRRSIDELREMNRQRRADPEQDLDKLAEELAAKRAELAELRAESRQLTGDLTEIEEQTAVWIREWRDTQRQAAVGERYPSIATLDERVYRDAEIVAVTGAGIEIRHAAGTARIRCGQLPAEWSERFVWKASEQRGVLAAEREQAAVLDRQVAVRMKEQERKKEKRLAAEKAAESRASLARLTRQKTVASNTTSSSRLNDPPRQVGRRSSYYYYRPWNDWNRRYCSSLGYRRPSSSSSYTGYSNCRTYGSHARPISGLFNTSAKPHTDTTIIRPHVPSTVKPPYSPER